MKTIICGECEAECELLDIDHGGWEEVWGARVWCPAFTSVTDCCNSEDYEVSEE